MSASRRRLSALLTHADLLRRGLDLPVWITKVGPTTVGARAVSAHQQAEAPAFYVREAARRPWVAGLFLYGWRDSGTDPADGEQHYGLLDFQGNAKPGLALSSSQGRPGRPGECAAIA